MNPLAILTSVKLEKPFPEHETRRTSQVAS